MVKMTLQRALLVAILLLTMKGVGFIITNRFWLLIMTPIILLCDGLFVVWLIRHPVRESKRAVSRKCPQQKQW